MVICQTQATEAQTQSTCTYDELPNTSNRLKSNMSEGSGFIWMLLASAHASSTLVHEALTFEGTCQCRCSSSEVERELTLTAARQ
eukprot:1161652-Pelagomonas_calceolata.AAC.6